MMKQARSLQTTGMLSRLGKSSSGAAMMEFAFSLPILMVLLLGGLETANFVQAHMKVNQIAMTVADNAGRVRTGIDESQIYEVFSGADVVGQSMNFKQNGRIVLSSLEPNGKLGSNAGQMINWQRCHGDLGVGPAYGRQNAGRNDSSMAAGMGATGNKIKSGDNTAVMFVEVTYQYRPVFTELIVGNSQIYYENAFNVRERTNQNITNTQSLEVKGC